MQVQKKLAQAIELHKAGRIEEAEKLYNQVFQQCRNNPDVINILSVAYSGLGDSYWDKNNTKAAIDNYIKAVRLNPKNIQAHNNLGILYSAEKNYLEALKHYEIAISINPDIAEIHNNLGTVYYELGDTEKAKKCHEQAIRLKPDYAEAYYNLGNDYKGNEKQKQMLKEPGNLEKAYASYAKAIELLPEFVHAYVNLGLIYHYKNQPEQEQMCYDRAEELCPNSSEIMNNIGNMHRDAGRMDKALEYFERAIQLDPQNNDAYSNAAITYLVIKNYEKGWKYYERRLLDNSIFQKKIRNFSQPVWTGQPLEGKTIYVYWEQGFGDTINFSRFLPVLNSMGAKVLFQPQKELAGLFKINTLDSEIIQDEPKNFDYHVPLLSIPGILGVNYNNITSNGRYLSADPDTAAYYREKYFNNNCLKIGINWQCKNVLYLDQYRSVPHISYFYPLLGFENTKIYSFQKGCGTDQLESLPEGIEVVNLGDEFMDFSDTAAALENIDLLISVDTAVPHLAGALGKPAWVLLQTVPDFRWGLEGEITPWYSSYRVFRQSKANEWEDVVQRVNNELAKVVNSKCTI